MHKYLLLVLLAPWSVLLVALWGLWRRFRLLPPAGLPLRSPSGEIVYTREDWERDARAEKPVRFWLSVAIPRRFRRKRVTDLTYQDKILVYPFVIFTNYVEKNRDKVFASAPEQIDPLYEGYWEGMAEVRSLYLWWTRREEYRRSALDKQDESVREFLKQKFEDEDHDMLARLVNVRKRLA